MFDMHTELGLLAWVVAFGWVGFIRSFARGAAMEQRRRMPVRRVR